VPNWCNNTITISGPKDTITAIWERANQEGNGLLNAMVPQPENIFKGNLGQAEEQMCEEQGIPNWYDWNIANWGTKWDVDISEGLELVEHPDGTASIEGWFDSAWSPPIEAYNTFSTTHPDCEIEAYYDEPGMAFLGYWSTQGGDDYYEYSGFTSENIREHIPEYLVEHWGLDERLAEWEEWEAEA